MVTLFSPVRSGTANIATPVQHRNKTVNAPCAHQTSNKPDHRSAKEIDFPSPDNVTHAEIIPSCSNLCHVTLPSCFFSFSICRVIGSVFIFKMSSYSLNLTRQNRQHTCFLTRDACVKRCMWFDNLQINFFFPWSFLSFFPVQNFAPVDKRGVVIRSWLQSLITSVFTNP